MGFFDFLKKNKEVNDGKEEELVKEVDNSEQEGDKEAPKEEAVSEETVKEKEENEESVETSSEVEAPKGPEGPKVSNSSFSLLDLVAEDDTPIFKDRADEEGFVPPDDEETILEKLSAGLTKTRNSLNESFNAVFSKSNIDEDFYEELEEVDAATDTLDECQQYLDVVLLQAFHLII